jgi:hypothetical protein
MRAEKCHDVALFENGGKLEAARKFTEALKVTVLGVIY